MPAEQDRTRLIGEIASVLSDATVPAEARAAALTLIGWLARRMPGEQPCRDGVEEMVRRACARAGGSSVSNGYNQCVDAKPARRAGDAGSGPARPSPEGARDNTK